MAKAKTKDIQYNIYQQHRNYYILFQEFERKNRQLCEEDLVKVQKKGFVAE